MEEEWQWGKLDAGTLHARLRNDFLSSCRVSNATVDELMTGAVLEMSRQIASDEISAERERLEEEKRQAEEER